jgi:serine/threonine-protein kinase RsbT
MTATELVTKTENLPVQTDDDVVRVRKSVRDYATEMGLSLVDQTKVVTAASELARNTIVHGKGGAARVEALVNGIRRGVRVTFEDQGPGIADIPAAMKDGFTTGSGLGLGLGGAKRLSNEFEISSTPGKGTRVSITKWKY